MTRRKKRAPGKARARRGSGQPPARGGRQMEIALHDDELIVDRAGPRQLKLVAWASHEAVRRLVDAIGDDEVALTEATAAVRASIADRAATDADRAQAGRVARALRRGWLAARIRRHPGARRFATLLSAVTSGRATPAQLKLAETLAREAA